MSKCCNNYWLKQKWNIIKYKIEFSMQRKQPCKWIEPTQENIPHSVSLLFTIAASFWDYFIA